MNNEKLKSKLEKIKSTLSMSRNTTSSRKQVMLWRQNESKNAALYNLHNKNTVILKSFNHDCQFSFTSKRSLTLSKQFWSNENRASTSRQKNYCAYVGTGRSLMSRKLIMSRHYLRKIARSGEFPGLIKERK